MTATQKAQAAFKICAALAEAIRDLGSIPSGHLYAQVCTHMGLEDYKGAINALKGAGLVAENNYVLTWTGPKE